MTSAIRNLAERRVPQVLAIYLGAAFGVVQFVDFVGSRYLLPAVWTDVTLLAMVILLPSVMLYTYHHGRPGRDEWHPTEKVVIPLNLVVLLGAVLFVGAGKPLAPTSERITVTDEQGNKREAVVPKKAYRKRVALFEFDNAAGNDAAWLTFGLPLMTLHDLLQQNFIEPWPSGAMRDVIRQFGYNEGSNIPLPLKRDVARELHINHFVAGKIERSGSEYVVTVQLYETESLKLLKERTYRASDPSHLADRISLGLLEDLQIPVLTDSRPDMPISELLTAHPGALRAYSEGVAAYQNRNDYQTAAQLFDQAAALDPTFAAAHLQRYIVAVYSGRQEQAVPALEAATKHSYRLPERIRELLKADHYMVRQDYARAFAVLEMLAQMYPDDIQIQQNLMGISMSRNDRDGVIAAGRKILELDPTRGEIMLRIAETYEQKGDVKSALKEYHAYTAKYPQEPEGYYRIGNLQRNAGARAEAQAAYEKALLLKPDHVFSMTGLAELQRNFGDFEAAEKTYAQALSVAQTPRDRDAVLRGLSSLHEFRGQIRKAIELREQALAETRKYAAPVVAVLNGMVLPWYWARVDGTRAERELEKLRQTVGPPWDLNVPIAEMMVYVELGDTVRAQTAIAKMEKAVREEGVGALTPLAAYGRGRIAELRGDCNTAVKEYQAALDADPSDKGMHTQIGRCYRKLREFDKAEAELNKMLAARPANGQANLEMGLLWRDRGDAAKARIFLQRALNTWRNADAGYRHAREAREALAALPAS